MAYVHAVVSAAPPPPTGEPALPSPQPPPSSMVPPRPSTGPKGVIQIQGGIWQRGQVEDGNLHVLWLPGRSSGIISVDTDRFPRICGCMARLSCPRRRSGSRNHHSICPAARFEMIEYVTWRRGQCGEHQKFRWCTCWHKGGL